MTNQEYRNSIIEKYGVDPGESDSQFKRSLEDQYNKKGKLTEKQISALKNKRYGTRNPGYSRAVDLFFRR